MQTNLAERMSSVMQRALFSKETKFQGTNERNVTDGLYAIADAISSLASAIDRFGNSYLKRL